MSQNKKSFKTSIGGQAVIEGIMMNGVNNCALAVRKPDQSIHIETWEKKNTQKWYRKVPVVRGIFNFISMLQTGYRCLMRSAEVSGMEESEEPSKFDAWVEKKLGNNAMQVFSAIAMVLGVAIALGLFFLLPSYLVKLLNPLIPSPVVLTIIEGVIKIAIFIVYLALVSQMSDIRRVFEYHGAEHKTIACYEAGEELIPENIKNYSRFHPRCGTSFILIVLVLSIIVSSFITWNSVWIRFGLKLLSLPLVVGLAYEVIKLAGRYDNPVTRIVSAPGLWLQHLTTREPDESQMEVAVAAMNEVLPKSSDENDRW